MHPVACLPCLSGTRRRTRLLHIRGDDPCFDLIFDPIFDLPTAGRLRAILAPALSERSAKCAQTA
jgi:hypothetical protein